MAVLVTATFALPSLHLYTWTALGYSAAAAVVVGVWRNRPRRRGPWLLTAAALASFATGDLIAEVLSTVLGRAAVPSVADAFYLAVYPLLAAGMIGLYRLGVVRRDSAGLLDALTLTAGVGLLSWIFLISPYLSNPELSPLDRAIWVAYPLCDIMILAVGARLFTAARRTPAVVLLATGAAGLLAADVAYGLIQLRGGWAVGGPVDVGWVVFYSLWGAAALHPSMRDLTEPKVVQRNEDSLRRLALLGLSSLIAPTVLLVEVLNDRVHNGGVIAVLSAVLSLLVLLRLGGAVNVHRRAVARERALRQAGAALLTATDPGAVGDVVREAVARLLPPGLTHRVVLTATTDDDHTRPMSMLYTASLDGVVGAALDGFEVVLRCRVAGEHGPATGVPYALFVAADEVALVALQEAAQVLAAQAALTLERIALSAEIDRRNSEAYFRTLVLNTSDVILIVDEADRIRYASPSATHLFTVADLTGVALADLVDPGSAGEVRRRLDAVRSGAEDHHEEDWLVRRAGERRALVEVSCRDLRAEPTVSGLVLTLRDVTEGRRLANELYQRATFDSLTGLPNREVFLADVQAAVERAAGAGRTVGVLIIELDDFKVVNDTMGHGAGDELLLAVGRRLADSLRTEADPDGTVARLGGDEFAAVVRAAATPEDIQRTAELILDVFAEPFVLSHGVVTAAASVGVATTTEASDAQELLRHADLAVYVAKDAGKARWRRYEASLHTAVVERLKLRSDLDRAVSDGAFLLHFQPIVALADATTVGFEALVRWNHPTRGMVPPMDFIDLAEECGLIVPLGAWVLQHAVDAATQWWRSHPGGSPYVSVNVSARQIRTAGFVDSVRRELAHSGLPAGLLTLEITESLLLHDDGPVADGLNALRELGVRIAIDDFGTGFSSLSYLRRLPVDVLKLDKSFIDTIAASDEQHAVVDTIIQLAQILQLGVVAEGIETVVEKELLMSMGCRHGQGYLFSRPVGYADATKWLSESTSPPVDTDWAAA